MQASQKKSPNDHGEFSIEPEIVDSLQNAVQNVVNYPGADLKKFAEIRVDVALIPTFQITFIPRH